MSRILMSTLDIAPDRFEIFCHKCFYTLRLDLTFTCNDVVICVLLCSQRQLPAVSKLVQKGDENSY